MREFAVAMPGRRVLSLSVLIAFSLVVIVGCGERRDYELAPVSGHVTVNGKPMPGLVINFQPRGKTPEDLTPGPGSFATIDEQGRYSLRTADEHNEEGAVVGKHVVRLIVPDSMRGGDSDADDPALRSRVVLPKKAVDGSTTFEVLSGGTDEADLNF